MRSWSTRLAIPRLVSPRARLFFPAAAAPPGLPTCETVGSRLSSSSWQPLGPLRPLTSAAATARVRYSAFIARGANTTAAAGPSVRRGGRGVTPQLRPTSGIFKKTSASETATTFMSTGNASSTVPSAMGQLTRRASSNQAGSGSEKGSRIRQFWTYWIAERPQHPRWSMAWWWDTLIVFTVFGITGSSTMFLVRPFMTKFLKLEGSMREGPWSYRLSSVAIITPLYSLILMFIGTLFGRHSYFKKVVLRMWSRFLPNKWIKALEKKV